MAFPLPDTNFKIYPPITIPFHCSPGQDHQTHSIIRALLFYFPMQVTLLACSRDWQTTNRISPSPLYISLNVKHYTSSLPQELILLIIQYTTLPCPHSLLFPTSPHSPLSTLLHPSFPSQFIYTTFHHTKLPYHTKLLLHLCYEHGIWFYIAVIGPQLEHGQSWSFSNSANLLDQALTELSLGFTSTTISTLPTTPFIFPCPSSSPCCSL